MSRASITLDELWEAEPDRPAGAFNPETIALHPEPVRRYLEHAVAPGTPLARAMRIRMRGEIRLTDRWLPFEAEQVTRWSRGFIWKAKVKMAPLLSVKGSDRWIDGRGEMRWKLLGVIPVMSADGPDISRSAAGRFRAETTWLPSVLVDPEVTWAVADDAGESGEATLLATVPVLGEEDKVELRVDASGRLLENRLERWGNPGGDAFELVAFGCRVDEEGSFGGYTIPTKLRVGWYVDSERFEREGEFFRAELTAVAYR
jgi:hypothetical protein